MPVRLSPRLGAGRPTGLAAMCVCRTTTLTVLARIFATYRLTAPTPSAGHSSKHTRAACHTQHTCRPQTDSTPSRRTGRGRSARHCTRDNGWTGQRDRGHCQCRRNECLQGTSNNTRFRRFLPWLSERFQRSCQDESPIRVRLTPAGDRAVVYDATRTPPVSALKRAQPPPARAEPAGGCCSRGSSSRS